VVGQLERNYEGGEEIQGILEEKSQKNACLEGGKMSTLRYGLPRFVTFIMWEEVAWGIVSGMAGKVDESTSKVEVTRGEGERKREEEEDGGRKWWKIWRSGRGG
jgi:hypothetical protein